MVYVQEEVYANFSRRDIILGLVQIFISIIFGLVVFVIMTEYPGEFLILNTLLWLLPIFIIFLIGSTLYSGIVTILSFKSGMYRSAINSIEKKFTGKRAVLGLSIWNIISAILLVMILGFLWYWVADQIPVELVVILALPFIGYAGLFSISSLRTFADILRKKKDVQIMRGLTAAGLIFLFVFGSFGSLLVFWNPQWSEGVEYEALFIPSEQEGRGYRIPSMVVLPDDIILAFCESRIDVMLDWGDIDIVMKRSIDGGDTWGSIQIIQDLGENTVHNPCPVFDVVTKTVWLAFCINYNRMFVMNSSDYGVTWSNPIELTEALGIYPEDYCATGPGNGIQLYSGRLIIPTTKTEPCVVYSDDHGSTWTRGMYGDVGEGPEEPQVFQAENGSLIMICRVGRAGGYKLVMKSSDGGETWDSYYEDKELPESGTQASVMRFTRLMNSQGSKSRVLFSSPNYYARGHMTLRMSYNDGRTWEVSKEIYEGPSAYSQIAILSDKTICVLFEMGKYDYRESLVFIKVDLEWLTDGEDQLIPDDYIL
jgi:sialidase-1